MPRPKAPKNLAVDGTDKLAAKAKPTDKHEKPELSIEEATVASPRPSRKRAGDYFDFDGEGSDTEPPTKPAETKAEPPKKRTRTTAADKREKKPKEKAAKEDAPPQPVKETKEKKETKSNAAKSNEASKQAKAEPKTKPKISTSTSPMDAVQDAAASVASEVSVDEGPIQKLVGSDAKGKARATAKNAKKPAKGKKTPEAKSSTTTEKAADVADKATKEAKGAVERTKKTAKSKASKATETAADVADTLIKEAKATAGKGKKTAEAAVPPAETITKAIDSVKKGAKEGARKMEKFAKANAPKAESTAEAVEGIKEGAKDGVEMVKKSTKAKASTTDTATKVTDEAKKQAMTGAGKMKKTAKSRNDTTPRATLAKKRKAASGDTETVKADILDPLSEHVEESAKKKQKTEKAKSKSIGDTFGGLIASAADSANAALGGFASSLLGGATDAAETAADTAKSGANKAKGKGKALSADVAESSKKLAPLSSSQDDEEVDSDTEPDDHTAALLAGFDSDGDEVDPPGPVFQEGQKVPELPNAKATAKKLEGVKADANEDPVVVYVGRIPHGFYEHEMRQYFTQFGDISRLRLSRNKKSGASKHWALIEFKSASVAQIVAATMNNYLMFGHILKCAVVPKDQLHEDIWKGADKRFKKIPRNKIEGRKHEVAVGREHWAGRIEREQKKRESKAAKTKEIGYEYIGGTLKGVESVPVKAKKLVDRELEQEKSLITAGGDDGQGTMIISEEVKTKKTKKTKANVIEATTSIAKKT